MTADRTPVPEAWWQSRQWKEHRTNLDGMPWRLPSGAPWRDLPERYGPWQTVYDRFTRYRKDGTLDRILQALQRCVDAGDLLVTDGRGLPLAVHVTAGQRQESPQFESVMNAVRVAQPRGRPRTRPCRVAGGKGYNVARICRWLRRHRIGAIIPQRSDERQRHRGRPLEFD